MYVLIIRVLINDSNDSNHSSKFTVLVVVAFTEKDTRHISRNDGASTQPSTEYFSG